jgi:sulfotransferase
MLNAITGLPRSGSTLLVNILNQNPEFHATATDILPATLNAIINTWSSSVEYKATKTERRDEVDILRAFVSSWHKELSGKTVFSKSRGWAGNTALFKKIGGHKQICLVRNPVDVVSSIIKRDQDTAEFKKDMQQSRLLEDQVRAIMDKGGMVGSCILNVEDVLNRAREDVMLLKYEELVESPKKAMKSLYEFIEADYFEHDFEKVESSVYENDLLYNNKFPHTGAGKVEPSPRKLVFSEAIAKGIINAYPKYSEIFGYTK